jgi:sugar lactone lactonase YvrE
MMLEPLIVRTVTPPLGVPGGEIEIRCRGFRPDLPYSSQVLLGNVRAEIISASEERINIRLPESPQALGVALKTGDYTSPVFPFSLAQRLADGLQPVCNPVITSDGAVITTISGRRGQQVAQPLIKVTRRGEKIPYPCEIMNPTGLALDKNGQLYVSSRNDGVVYRYTEFEQLDVVVEDAGVACGIAFDSEGFLYVGDRNGKIYRVDEQGNKEDFATLEPSISAYHLAVDSRNRIYVTGPTLSLRDPLYRISTEGKVQVLLEGLARPQGMAFLPGGDLLLAAAYQGKKGIFRYSPETGMMVRYIAAPILVGLAVSGEDIFLADNSSIFWTKPEGAFKSIS